MHTHPALANMPIKGRSCGSDCNLIPATRGVELVRRQRAQLGGLMLAIWNKGKQANSEGPVRY